MIINQAVKFISSLRLTVTCLLLAILIVFFGTIAQVNEGLYLAQQRWFHSFFIWFGPAGGSWKLPLMPGGYLVGTVLLVNLIAAHIQRFRFTWTKLGIHVTHGGLILLLVGQLATDMLSRESTMSFSEGETRDFIVSPSVAELAFIAPAASGDKDIVVSVPQSLLKVGGEISHPQLPFKIRVQKTFVNAVVRQRAPMMDKDAPPATAGFGPKVTLIPQPETKKMDERNTPAAILELSTTGGAALGTWVVSPGLAEQPVPAGDQVWRMTLRYERTPLPFSVKLLQTKHEVYRGTDIPKNFQSRVRIENAQTRESREVDIYMNNPLRYGGLTFYQYQMGRDEADNNRGNSVLQVVRNPSWLTPYVGCGLVAGGLVIQFMMHLIGFIKKRRTA
jgi:hypothetical protein